MRSEGLRHGPVEVMAQLARGQAVPRDAYYFRTAVRFTTGAPQWAHLNKLLAIAVGQREASARPAWSSWTSTGWLERLSA